MLNILSLLLLINASAVLAGDLYLVCEKDDAQDMHSVTIESGKAMMILNLDDQTPILIDLRKTSNHEITEFKLRLKNLRTHEKEVLKIRSLQEFPVGAYICAVRD